MQALRFSSLVSRAGRARAVLGTAASVFATAVIAVAVMEGLFAPSPPFSNIRFHDGAYRVNAVAPGDVLEVVGVEPGDEIIALDGAPFAAALDFHDRFRRAVPGDSVSFSVRRGRLAAEIAASLLAPAHPPRKEGIEGDRLPFCAATR